MAKTFRILFKVILLLILLIAGYFIFMTLTDYRPDEVTRLPVENNHDETLQLEEPVSVMTFNIGYCGLDDEQDFFLDGGTESRSESREKTLENLSGILRFTEANDSDIYLFQEVDIRSSRSYKINQYDRLSEELEGYASALALNYKVPWIPVPLTKPMGTVKAGLATFSRYTIKEAERYQYPGEESWPRQLALLDRCFLETRIPVENGKELVLLNSHLSAYDKGGQIRKQQLDYLKKHILTEYNKGHYIIVGGDWNHLIPGTNPERFDTTQDWPEWLVKIPESFKPEGFQWVADSGVPTNRSVDRPYEKGINFLSVIDGFLVSPNVKVLSVKGFSLDFEYSDHNPVQVHFILKKTQAQ